MAAPSDKIWNLIADVRNTGKFSPEVMQAEWLDGATGPALGARLRGHVKRNEIGPVYWTTCRVTACEPGREFGFDVLVGDSVANGATCATCAPPSSASKPLSKRPRVANACYWTPIPKIGIQSPN